MPKRAIVLVAVLLTGLLSGVSPSVSYADSLSGVPASPFTGPAICKPGFPSPQCLARPLDTTQDLAYQGNGFALAAVARDVIPGFAAIHRPEYANDGFYGNGSSWISNSANSWLKIDLGRTALIDRITFGRDRLGNFNDRDPGQFTIAIALSDNVYANGNDSNDLLEYTLVFNSAGFGFSGFINSADTLQVSFTNPQLVRFAKLTFTNNGTAIDEVEIFGSPVPEPATLLLLGSALAGALAWRRRRQK